jgi:hypothetical protein
MRPGTGRRGGDRATAPAGAWSRSAETWDRQQGAGVEKPLWHCRADVFSGDAGTPLALKRP